MQWDVPTGAQVQGVQCVGDGVDGIVAAEFGAAEGGDHSDGVLVARGYGMSRVQHGVAEIESRHSRLDIPEGAETLPAHVRGRTEYEIGSSAAAVPTPMVEHGGGRDVRSFAGARGRTARCDIAAVPQFRQCSQTILFDHAQSGVFRSIDEIVCVPLGQNRIRPVISGTGDECSEIARWWYILAGDRMYGLGNRDGGSRILRQCSVEIAVQVGHFIGNAVVERWAQRSIGDVRTAVSTGDFMGFPRMDPATGPEQLGGPASSWVSGDVARM